MNTNRQYADELAKMQSRIQQLWLADKCRSHDIIRLVQRLQEARDTHERLIEQVQHLNSELDQYDDRIAEAR